MDKLNNIVWAITFWLLGAMWVVPYMGYQIAHADSFTISAVVLQNKYYIQKLDKTVLGFETGGRAVYSDGTKGWSYGITSLYWLPNY